MENKIKIIIIAVMAVAVVILIGAYVRGNKCGDGICQPIEQRKGSCPQDCAVISPEAAVCGNKVCEVGENPGNCPQDCEVPVIQPLPEGSVSKTCAELGGYTCDVGEECEGVWLDVADTFSCCSQSCKSSVGGDVINIDAFELAPENEDLGDSN